ncbi:WD40/PQQ-like beta propeller repeat containing protein [Halalkaliarchaeum sp. AArc-CO]|uniref:PQQ-like beta-propeller repeat protein n=1 Tax=unclassified Halalkaliarchaeum TaxID=2678344 RepID=UPI00217D8060|nr:MULTISPECIES: PQQ-like beta-propeller repeat protein [unclassified Halalkaliarchaeum]MDR5671869.1 PQQ-like beta-propeller repeat protein [Halalkaliarchaeum sp. AArc-GB]UWG51373.1 WD40/PQQ-like beta propeller repeat containing protein [Halalkaliarchaeum sp. AArc-CO]
MKNSRRRLLAAIGTGLATGIAGCGYAPGGGDVRREASLLTGIGGLGGSNRFDVEGDRIAAAKSGQQWVGEFGDRSFETATTVHITDRDAEEIGEFVHLEPTLDLALGERLVVLDEAGRLVASEPIRAREDADETDDTDGLEEAWRIELDDPDAPIAAADGTVYVPDGNRLLAVRDGTVVWERSLAGPAETLQAQDGVVLAAIESAALALDPDGGARWEFEIDGPATFAVDGDLTVLRARGSLSGDDTDLAAVDTGTGDVRWSTTVQGRDARPAIADGRVHLVVHGRVTAYDRDTGDRRWETADVGAAPPIVAGTEGVYSLGENCEAIGVDSEGRRWSRTLDRGSCSVVDGWIDGETVAFLLAAGGIVWLQRVDEEPGLLG